MANRRNLKKEINFLHYELLSDCVTFIEINKKQSEDNIVDIINQMLDIRATAIAEINKPTSNMSRKEVKERYNKISDFILKNTDESYEKLSKLPRD